MRMSLNSTFAPAAVLPGELRRRQEWGREGGLGRASAVHQLLVVVGRSVKERGIVRTATVDFHRSKSQRQQSSITSVHLAQILHIWGHCSWTDFRGIILT